MPSDDRKQRKRSHDRSQDRSRKRDRKDDRRRSRSRDRRKSKDRADNRRRDERKPYDQHDRRGSDRRDDRKEDRKKEVTPPSLVPRAKTPPEGGTGGFFVRGGIQKSTMKKSDNVDDHVFMPGEKIGEHFITEDTDQPDPDNQDGIEGMDRDMRDAKRAANADDYQVKMLQAAHKYNRTEENMEVKMVAARIQNGYKPGGGIRANEIKGFLNIWCNQRRLKPEYEFIERGKPPKGTFICKLKIEGFNYIADCEARTKREAQADAAWDFANKLVELGYCNKSDLPNKTMATVNNQGCVPTEWKSVLSDEMILSAGHWTPDNCRKRLSMFCNYEKISCEILNTAIGPDHAKIAIAELKLTLRKYGKEFYAKEQARTKKLANSLVAWSIMKQLYQADMMEGFGERMKKAADSKFLSKRDIEPGEAVGNDIQKDLSMDPNTGDWTLDSSRTRLHEFFLQRGIDVEYGMLEIGFPPDRVYQAQLEFEVDGKRYYSFYECDNKKMTQKKTAFEIVVQLYHDSKIEPNTGRRNWGDGPSGNVLGGAMHPPPQHYLNPNCTPRERDEYFVKTKLDAITPHPNFANTVNSTLVMIESRLKKISDEMLEIRKALPGHANFSDDDNRELMGVMRVGALAANTVLSGECEFLMVMMMKEKPTYQMLARIAKALDEKMPHMEVYNFSVRPDYNQGGIEVLREREPQMMILIKLTSTKWREADAKLLVAEGDSPDGDDRRKRELDQSRPGIKPETGRVNSSIPVMAPLPTMPRVSNMSPIPEQPATLNTNANTAFSGKRLKSEGNEHKREADIEAQLTVKTDPSTSTLNIPKDEDIEEGEIKMVEPEDDEAAKDSEKDEKWKRKIDKEESKVKEEVKEEAKPVGIQPPLTPDKLLAETSCMAALAELRHSRWFASSAQNISSAVPLIRLVREMCQRIRTWSLLSDWQINLLCQKALESARMPLLPSDGIRRVVSTLAGGVVLPKGLGIRDTCEEGIVDSFASLSVQDREDLTASAQHALRLLSFGVMHKILGIQPPQ